MRERLGARIAEALGFNPSEIKALHIHIQAGQKERVEIEQVMKNGEKLITILREYELILKNEEKLK